MGKQSEVQAFAELATPKCQQNLAIENPLVFC